MLITPNKTHSKCSYKTHTIAMFFFNEWNGEQMEKIDN